MKPATLEKLVWVLIYGGLLAVCLGLFVARADEPLAWSIGVVGAVTAAVGVVLIYVRSRMKDSP
jgi:hypothetical protein